MATGIEASRAREALDSRLRNHSIHSTLSMLRAGWIRAVREALQMTAAELATRMGVTGRAVRSAEDNELSGGIRLDTLRRAAEAMDCTLVYGFVPVSTLKDTVERQAEAVLQRHLERSGQTMALEEQGGRILDVDRQELLEEIIRSGRLWSDS